MKQEKSDPEVIYMTSKEGPFECQRCEYFERPSSCKKVEGVIDPQGCCNFFERGVARVTRVK